MLSCQIIGRKIDTVHEAISPAVLQRKCHNPGKTVMPLSVVGLRMGHKAGIRLGQNLGISIVTHLATMFVLY